jgi:tRNA-dihydrouridine synthase
MGEVLCEKYGVDGVLIGRAAEGNPAFAKASAGEASKEQRFAWMIEHAKVYEKIFCNDAYPPSPDGLRTGTRQERSFLPVRKHLGLVLQRI